MTTYWGIIKWEPASFNSYIVEFSKSKEGLEKSVIDLGSLTLGRVKMTLVKTWERENDTIEEFVRDYNEVTGLRDALKKGSMSVKDLPEKLR